MSPRGRTFVGAAVVALTLAWASPAQAASYNRYVWMQPPVDVANASKSTDKGCVTQLWHTSSLEENSRALDWNASCMGSSGEDVHFRARAWAPHEKGNFVGMRAEPVQANSTCGGKTLHRGLVRLRDTNTAVVKGYVSYQHVVISSTTTRSIVFAGVREPADGVFNSYKIADMVKDYGGSTCWRGYHVHENNVGTSSVWDSWNVWRYDSSADRCDCHQVDHVDSWTRRLQYTLVT